MSTTINSLSTPATTGGASPAATPQKAGVADLASRDTFLKLLIAQIRNQNPLQPTDGIQFVTQLAQFSSLEQNVQMEQDLSAIKSTLELRLPKPSPAADPLPIAK